MPAGSASVEQRHCGASEERGGTMRIVLEHSFPQAAMRAASEWAARSEWSLADTQVQASQELTATRLHTIVHGEALECIRALISRGSTLDDPADSLRVMVSNECSSLEAVASALHWEGSWSEDRLRARMAAEDGLGYTSQLLIAASWLGAPRVRKSCEHALRRSLCIGNVVELSCVADAAGAHGLLSDAYYLLRGHFCEEWMLTPLDPLLAPLDPFVTTPGSTLWDPSADAPFAGHTCDKRPYAAEPEPLELLPSGIAQGGFCVGGHVWAPVAHAALCRSLHLHSAQPQYTLCKLIREQFGADVRFGMFREDDGRLLVEARQRLGADGGTVLVFVPKEVHHQSDESGPQAEASRRRGAPTAPVIDGVAAQTSFGARSVRGAESWGGGVESWHGTEHCVECVGLLHSDWSAHEHVLHDNGLPAHAPQLLPGDPRKALPPPLPPPTPPLT